MSARETIGAGAVLFVVALVTMWLWLDSAGAFTQRGATGDTLRLVCPLH
jgi:hypothetical protein